MSLNTVNPKHESTPVTPVKLGPRGGSTFRIRGVPLSWNKDQLQAHLERHEPDSQPLVKSLAIEVDGHFQTATVNFQSPPSKEKTSNPWYISLPESDDDNLSVSGLPLRLDGAFLSITTLFAPPVEDHEVEYVYLFRDKLIVLNTY
jgi:hypothetical protein